MEKVMLKVLASSEVQAYIADHENVDTRELVLKNRMILGIPSALIADQINGRIKAKQKLPDYYACSGVAYPPSVHLEQSSSSLSAQFKLTETLGRVSVREVLLDLTGGFGIDTYYFSRSFRKVIYVEPDAGLLEVARHNHFILGAQNIEYHNCSAEQFLVTFAERASVIYADPSRRNDNGRKVAGLRASSPDIITLQDSIFMKSDYLLVKAAPLLDIKAALGELKHVSNVTVLAIDNDCKELQFLGMAGFSGEASIKAINLTKQERQEVGFTFTSEMTSSPEYSSPAKYIYEPNVAALKAGAFRTIGTMFGLRKLDRSSHLYTADELRPDFPGRIFHLDAIAPSSPKKILEYLPDGQANIIIRNYPSSVAVLQATLKLSEGGEKYLIATSAMGRKFLLIASRIK